MSGEFSVRLIQFGPLAAPEIATSRVRLGQLEDLQLTLLPFVPPCRYLRRLLKLRD